MFVIIRGCLLVLGTAVLVIKIRALNIRKKKTLMIISVFAWIMLISVSAMFPIENEFITFNTPEEAFRYAENKEIEMKLQGERSCLIMYRENYNTSSFYFIPMVGDGYKLPTVLTKKRIQNTQDIKDITCFIDIYRIRNTSDHYILAHIATEEVMDDIYIYDSQGKVQEERYYIEKYYDSICFICVYLSGTPENTYFISGDIIVPLYAHPDSF